MEKLLEKEKIATESFEKLNKELEKYTQICKDLNLELVRLQGEYRLIQKLKEELSENK